MLFFEAVEVTGLQVKVTIFYFLGTTTPDRTNIRICVRAQLLYPLCTINAILSHAVRALPYRKTLTGIASIHG
jgi:hypothetical protein